MKSTIPMNEVCLHEGDRQILQELLGGINRIADALEKQLDTPVKDPVVPPDINVGWLGASLDPDHPCTHCSSAPHNGGSGFCNCTLPYFYEQRQQPPVMPLYKGWRMGVTPDGYRVNSHGYQQKTHVGDDIGMFPHDLTPGLH